MVRSQVQSLQVFRGFAALVVVAHHSALSTDAFVSRLPDSAKTLFDMGHLGVDFFFVLSGFIIMYAHMDDAATLTASKRYVLKRLSRIYPAYLPVGMALLVLYAVMPDLSASGGRHYSLISSLLLLPADSRPALSVAWTLVHELMFYLVFVLFFVSRHWLAAGLLAWAALIFLVNYWYTPTGWLRYPLSLMNIEFILGVGAAWVVRYQISYKKAGWIAVLGAAIAICALLLMTQENGLYLRLVLAMGLALVIVGFTVHEQSSFLGWPALLLILGNASYSIYLIHNPLLSITQRVAGRMQLTWPLAMILGIVLSLFAGWLYYLSVERTALRFFQQRLRR
ncbi:acyltransferase [Methylobacter sp. BlB1]|uniref:acyltransferase family protein n=1 Tax=Methylobacter sp. BlB1 TaxID=2785914 RepID=UPI0018939BEC|nr:acyltransferase [Methylobacter sp. BlB1]MBF6650294.1 acyltransferase [Methylobacter sp. BlB1]